MSPGPHVLARRRERGARLGAGHGDALGPRSSVRSTGTTASAPSGTAAPVEMRTAVPGSTRTAAGCPARDSPDHPQLGRRPATAPRSRPWRSCRRAARRCPRSRARRGSGRARPPAATSSPLERACTSASTRSAGLRDGDRIAHARHPFSARSRRSCGEERSSSAGEHRATPSLSRKFRRGSAVFGGRIVMPPRTSGVRTDRRLMTPIRGPIARVDRSREELAKAFLVRLIERASLDEIRDLPTERIARELPALISDILQSVAGQRLRPLQAGRRPDGASGCRWPLSAAAATPRCPRWRATWPPCRPCWCAPCARSWPRTSRSSSPTPSSTWWMPPARSRRRSPRSWCAAARASSSRRPTRTPSPGSATSATSSARSPTCSTFTSATTTPSGCC